MFLEIAVVILSLVLIILTFLLFKQKQQTPEVKEKAQTDNSNETKLQEQQIISLASQLDNSHQEIQKLKELILTNFADHKSSLRERFDYLDKSFAELNKIFASSKRGMLGNSYLNELLGIILPRDDSVYQLEFTLKKKTEKGESLRVDAIVFGAEKKNNLAIDSKFPLDNYLVMMDESRSVEEREQAQKDFQNDLKRHVDKICQYLSEEDGIYQCVMFIPSDTVYFAINDLRFYGIIESACQKKVWICSPTTFYIVLNQIILANRNWELYKNSSKILEVYLEIAAEFSRFAKRWKEVNKTFSAATKKISDLETTVGKILEKNEKLQKFQGEENKEEIGMK
jgi:DNA recombination protein RmuC